MNPPGGDWPYPGVSGALVPWSESQEARNGNAMVSAFSLYTVLIRFTLFLSSQN